MSYSSNAYDFGMFEAHESRQEAEVRKKSSNLKKVAPKTAEDKMYEEKQCRKKAVSLLIVLAVVFSAVSLQISANAKRYELIRQIAQVEAEIKIVEAENVRLNSELDGRTSITIVDNYATEVLGMTKIENYQVDCVNLSGGDKVIFSSNSR